MYSCASAHDHPTNPKGMYGTLDHACKIQAVGELPSQETQHSSRKPATEFWFTDSIFINHQEHGFSHPAAPVVAQPLDYGTPWKTDRPPPSQEHIGSLVQQPLNDCATSSCHGLSRGRALSWSLETIFWGGCRCCLSWPTLSTLSWRCDCNQCTRLLLACMHCWL